MHLFISIFQEIAYFKNLQILTFVLKPILRMGLIFMRLCVAPGAQIFKASDECIAISGLSSNVYVQGEFLACTAILKAYSGATGTTEEEAIARGLEAFDGNSNEARADMQALINELRNQGVLVPVVEPTVPAPLTHFCTILVCSPCLYEIPPTLAALGLPVIGVPLEDTEEALEAHQNSVVVALGLSDADLHRLNRAMLAAGRPWIFATTMQEISYVSSILSGGPAPCFACLRLQRLGTLEDLPPNGAMEAMVSGTGGFRPIIEVPARSEDLLHLQFLSSLIAEKLRKTTDPNMLPVAMRHGPQAGFSPAAATFHRIVRSTCQVTPVQALKVPGCTVCR